MLFCADFEAPIKNDFLLRKDGCWMKLDKMSDGWLSVFSRWHRIIESELRFWKFLPSLSSLLLSLSLSSLKLSLLSLLHCLVVVVVGVVADVF